MKRLLPLIVAACCLTLWGCGKKEEPKPASLPPAKPAVAPPAAPATTNVAPAAPSAVKETKEGGEPKPPDAAVASTDEGFALATAGVNSLREAGDFAGAIEKLTKLQETFPKRADEIAGILAQMKDDRRASVDLEYAVKQLTKDDQTSADVAIQKLTEGGEVARIILRKAVREREDAVAAEALAVLSDMGDEKAPEVIVQRFLKKPDSEMRPKLMEALRKSAGAGSATIAAPLYPLVKDDAEFKNRDVVGVLAAVLDKTCEGKSEKFDQLVGQPGAYDQLKKYVQSAIGSTNDPAIARWGSNQAMYFKVLVSGIKGEYYEGSNFEKLRIIRKDEYIWIDDRKFLYFPDGRQDNLSIRWEGKILIPSAGKYTFKIISDDGQRLWVDDKKLIDAWGTPSTQMAAADLDAGLHDIKIEYQQINGSGSIRMTWSGPGFDDKPVKQDVLRVVPWTAAKAAADPAAEKK